MNQWVSDLGSDPIFISDLENFKMCFCLVSLETNSESMGSDIHEKDYHILSIDLYRHIDW